MRKMGFTLAEVLITMTIIGVVAALTTPVLLHNVATADIGPKLAKFRATVENANKMILVENDVNRLSVLIRRNANNARTAAYTGLLQNFMRLDSGADPITHIKDYAGNNESNLQAQVSLFTNDRNEDNAARDNTLTANQIIIPLRDSDNAFTFRTVEGMAVHFFIAPSVGGAGAPQTEPESLGVILVDINGSAIPNSLGKDIFGFILGNDGMLTPIGSRAVGSGNDDAFANDSSSWTTSCTADAVTSQGLTCTGSIFANDLKVVYQD